jgi:hypothetical protein
VAGRLPGPGADPRGIGGESALGLAGQTSTAGVGSDSEGTDTMPKATLRRCDVQQRNVADVALRLALVLLAGEESMTPARRLRWHRPHRQGCRGTGLAEGRRVLGGPPLTQQQRLSVLTGCSPLPLS